MPILKQFSFKFSFLKHLKGHGAPDNKKVGKPLIFDKKFNFITLTVVNDFLGSTKRLIREH